MFFYSEGAECAASGWRGMRVKRRTEEEGTGTLREEASGIERESLLTLLRCDKETRKMEKRDVQ